MSRPSTPGNYVSIPVPSPAAPTMDDGKEKHVSRRAKLLVVIAGVVLVLAAAITVTALHFHKKHVAAKVREEREREAAKGPKLGVTPVVVSSDPRQITLPAEVRAYEQTTLYAKVSGYVKTVKVERGQRVKKGDLLAELESPETASDVVAARSDAIEKKIAADRMRVLAGPGVVSMQELDNAINLEEMAKANLAKATATQGYTAIRAPFDGLVTARYADPGALLPAATTGGTQTAAPLVDVAAIDDLRVFAYVGQDAAPFVHEGDEVNLWQDEAPGRRIPAKVAHATGALDPRTRTMQVEVDLDNRPWGILPGSFVHMRLDLRVPPSPAVPDEALLVRDGKMHVAVIDADEAHLVPVELGPDDGRTTRVMRGLHGGERVGVNVPIEIVEGSKVQPVDRPPAQEKKTGSGEAVAPKKGDVPTSPSNSDAGK